MTDNTKPAWVERTIRLPARQDEAVCRLLMEENGSVSDEAFSEFLSQAVSWYFFDRLRESGRSFVEKHGLTDEEVEALIEETIAEVRAEKSLTGKSKSDTGETEAPTR